MRAGFYRTCVLDGALARRARPPPRGPRRIADLGEEHGHRVLRVCGKGTK